MAIEATAVHNELSRIDSLPLSPEDKAIMRDALFRRMDAQLEADGAPTAKTFSAGKEVDYQVSPDPDTYRWFKPNTEKFVPRFRAVQEFDKTYTLCDGEIQGIRLRKLVSGDYAFLASIAPRAITHLKGNADLFDPVSGEPSFVPVLTAVVGNALQEWDYEAHGPTGAALEVLQAIVKLFRWENRDGSIHESPFTVQDLLNSDPSEVIDLVMGMYRANRDFFMRISTSNGTIRAIFTILGGIFGNITSSLKEMAAQLIQMVQELTIPTSDEEGSSGSGGAKNGGRTSSSRSSKKQKATSPENTSSD